MTKPVDGICGKKEAEALERAHKAATYLREYQKAPLSPEELEAFLLHQRSLPVGDPARLDWPEILAMALCHARRDGRLASEATS